MEPKPTWILILDPRIGDGDAEVLAALQTAFVTKKTVDAIFDSFLEQGYHSACVSWAENVTEVFEGFEDNFCQYDGH